jgi:uncharacterized membrane protein HdeD (DUF308 family)
VLVFAGTVMGWNAFTEPASAQDDRWVRILRAGLTLVSGICILAVPLTGALTLTVFLAAWFLGSGALLLYAFYRTRGQPMATMVAVDGGLSLLLGLLITLDLPSSAAWAIGLLVGVSLLFFGVRTLMAASLLKRLFEV